MSQQSSSSQPHSPANHQPFGKIREFFWPIYSSELKKFMPMAFMQFFIIFVYNILRNTKDALVVHEGGAAVLPFLKGYIVFPASILFVVVYAKLVDTLNKKQVFMSVTAFFMAFFGIFGFIIFPNKAFFHPSQESIEALRASVPFLEHFLSIFRTWSFSAFYVMAELWGSVMNSLLFWQFANEITKTSEAKRFYAMFILISNFSLIFAGGSIKLFSSSDSTADAIYFISASVLISSAIVIFLYNVVGRVVAKEKAEEEAAAAAAHKKPKKKKVKLSASESLKLLFSSKYLLMITLLVLSYGIAINLIELLWKNQLRHAFHSINEYNSFMGNLSIGTGIATILIVLASKSVVSRFGWFWGAIATPLTILITGVFFFAFVFFGEFFEPLVAMAGLSALMMSVWIGTIQNILSKSIKYGLFDPTKEMAYIPLDEDLKAKGKAAIDVIGGRLGKASGGYISSALLIFAPFIGIESSVSGISPFLSIFLLSIIAIWIYAVVVLNGLYSKALEESESEEG